MLLMTSQILKSADVTKTQKFQYLESETLFFLQIKKIHYLHIKGYFMTKNSLVAEVTFEAKNNKPLKLIDIGTKAKSFFLTSH